MQQQDIDQLRSTVDLRLFAEMYTSPLSGNAGSKERSGACPKCGGEDRFHVQRGAWFCRQCAPALQGRRRDVFDLAIHLGKASDFPGACNFVAQWAGNPIVMQVQSMRAQAASKQASIDWKDRSWQFGINAMNETRKRQLWQPGGAAGLAYLTERGLEPETMRAWGVGYGMGRKDGGDHPAVSFAWTDDRGTITAMQNRFIASGGQRYSFVMYKGYAGERILYRLPESRSDTLVIVEGEINAMSIWQASPYDVVSCGSQDISPTTSAAIAALAPKYKGVLVWCDKMNRAQMISGIVQGVNELVKVISSPMGKDANDFLQMGRLRGFLAAAIDSLNSKEDDSLPCKAIPGGAKDEAALLDMAENPYETFERRRDARWVYRWRVGLTERTAQTQAAAQAAAQRLGVTL